MPGVLSGKVAVVTGAGRGVGRAISEEFAREGAHVLAVSRTQASLDSLVAGATELGGSVVALARDLGDRDTPRLIVDQAVKRFGTVDILVYCARSHGSRDDPSDAIRLHPLEDFPPEEWEWMFETGLKANLRLMQEVFPYMKRKGGRIINFGSRAGVIAQRGQSCYSVNKEAIRALSRAAAVEWGRYGITVNVINPVIETSALAAAKQDKPEFHERLMMESALQRYGTPLEAARLVVFLAGPDSAYLTGMTFMMDGGRTILP